MTSQSLRRSSLIAGVVACMSLVMAVGHVQAGLVGNDVSLRAQAADGATTVFYTNWYSAPRAGTVDSVDIFFQNAATPFNFYVLRPTATKNNYDVIYDSGAIIPAGTPNTAVSLALPNGPVNVQAGDLFAHYGRGIPYSDNNAINAVNPQLIYFSSPAAPVQGNTISLASPAFPLSGFNRDYAIAVNVPSVLEQVGFGTADAPLVDTATGVLGILDDHGFTERGQVNTWHFFSDSSAVGRFVTPLLLKETGAGGFEVTGIGTPRANTNTGLQMYDFDPIAGSDMVEDGYFAGWWDGNVLTGLANAGVIEWRDQSGLGSLPLFIDGNGFNIGTIYGTGGQASIGNFRRQYSLNFSTVHIPEPATVTLALMAGVGLLRRRSRTLAA